MRKVIFRTEETKRELVRKFNKLVQDGSNKGAAAKELGISYCSLLEWGKKYADELPTVTVTRKPYTKKDNSQKAIIIVTTLSNVSEVLRSL